MFGFFRTEEVVPLSLEESLLSFHTGRKFKPGKTVKVKLILLVLGEVETPTVSVTISEVDAQAEGGYKCLGLLREKPERVASLTLTMARAGIEGADRRGSKRLNFGARILSRKLPNFRAVTANINLTGAEILCEGAVETGLSMSLQFDLETVGMRELTLQAVTVWAGGSSVDKKSAVFRVGVKFTETHQRTMTAWQQLYQHLASVEGSSVMHRSMGGAVEADDPLGVRKDAKGAFASPTAGHQGNVPGPPPSAPGPLDLPKTSSSFGSATNPVGHGYLQAPPPPARGRIGLPPTREPGSTTGLPLTPASPAPPSSAPLGFEAPRNPSVPGFQPPPPPAGSDVSGFHPPRATSGPSFPGFQAPTLPGQQPGSGFRPPSPPAPSLSGFQPPPPPAGSAPVGFQPPPPPAGSAPVGFQPPPPPAGSAPVGFQPPPPPAGSAPVGFQPPPPPAGSAPVGFQPPPPPPPSTGFRPPPPPAGYKPDPPPR